MTFSLSTERSKGLLLLKEGQDEGWRTNPTKQTRRAHLDQQGHEPNTTKGGQSQSQCIERLEVLASILAFTPHSSHSACVQPARLAPHRQKVLPQTQRPRQEDHNHSFPTLVRETNLILTVKSLLWMQPVLIFGCRIKVEISSRVKGLHACGLPWSLR